MYLSGKMPVAFLSLMKAVWTSLSWRSSGLEDNTKSYEDFRRLVQSFEDARRNEYG